MQKNPVNYWRCSSAALGVLASIGLGSPVDARVTSPPPHPPHHRVQVGIASWYGAQHQGRLTASGERFDRRKLTAAHRTLPLDTRARVTNLANGRSVEVTINDRGPGVGGRVIDLSEQAARRLGMTRKGLAKVRIEVLAGGTGAPALD